MNLQLYYPVKPDTVNQGFGVNGAYYQAHGINIVGHNGIDFKATHGQGVYASHAGTCYPEIDGQGGNGVVLITDDQYDDGNGGQCYFKTIYWHLTQDDAVVHTGQHVNAGELIGYADNTGLSSGDHLHFGLKKVNPGEPPFSWVTLNPNNGYLGAIDPTPYFNGKYAQDIGVKPQHTFFIPLKYGDEGPEVVQLQRCLQSIGYFPQSQLCTGYYGSITRSSVFQFQKDYAITGPVSWVAVWSNFGNNVGPLTLAALNKVFA